MKYPKGYRRPGSIAQIAIRFPDELFHDILVMAKRERKGFNEMVIELCKCGKLDLEESDKHEAPDCHVH
jgi:hypothetical protein